MPEVRLLPFLVGLGIVLTGIGLAYGPLRDAQPIIRFLVQSAGIVIGFTIITLLTRRRPPP